MSVEFEREIDRGERFEFGENWRRFLATIDERRIERAVASLRRLLRHDDLREKSFLDVGCGSGLFSLAARRLGARVHSFDFDPQSVACAVELRRRFDAPDAPWTIERGSVLDRAYMERLGAFDVVYSWGVLHHTGEMWRAIENALLPAREGTLVAIALYNDWGHRSRRWLRIKTLYNKLPRALRPFLALAAFARIWGPIFMRDLLALHPSRSWRGYDSERGTDPWRDVIDWVGGLPFEVARPDQVFDYFHDRGFVLERLFCPGGNACNEFAFVKAR